MKMVIAFLVALALAGASFADDKPAPDPEMAARIAAAQAKLKAKAIAAAQAVASDDPAVLKAIILEQKQQIESLRAEVTELRREILGEKNGQPGEKNGQPGPITDAIAHRCLTEGMTVEEASRASMSRPKLVVGGKSKVYHWDIHGKTGTHTVSHTDAFGGSRNEVIADFAIVGSVEATFIDGKLSAINGRTFVDGKLPPEVAVVVTQENAVVIELNTIPKDKELWRRGDFSSTVAKQGVLWQRD